MTVLWDYGTQGSAPGSGPPGAWSGDPGDTVGYLWEEPAELSNGSIKIRALLGCSDETNWAGAVIYGSIDGTTYQRIGLTKQRSILGVTTTLLAAGASDWQPTGTVTVDLSTSPGALNSVNATAAFFGANMCLIGDELCTFVTATLTAPNVYQLTGVLRAWYDTERVAHAIGSRFALITVSQDKFELTKDELLTETLWKATSLNLSGHEQTLADAHAYSLYIYGRGLHTEYQNGRTRQFIAGEALSEGDHVYLKAADGKVWKAVSTSTPKLGLVQSPKTPVVANEKVYVQVDGLMKCAIEPTPVGTTWAWTVGSYLYGTAVAGTLSHTNDGYAPVALALTATEILIFAPRKPDGIIQTLNAIGWAPFGDGIHAGYVGGGAGIAAYKYSAPAAYLSLTMDALNFNWLVSGTSRMTLTGSVLGIDHIAEKTGGHNIVLDNPLRAATAVNRRYYHIPLGSANPGASGPTWVVADAHTTGGWQLNAVGEILRGQTDIHADWDGATDLVFEVRWMTNADNSGGGASDHVDISMTMWYKGIGDVATKTQTVEVPTVIGTAARYKQFTTLFTLDWDFAGNVLEVGDNLAMNLHLETDTSHVDDIVVVGITFYYATTHFTLEAGDV